MDNRVIFFAHELWFNHKRKGTKMKQPTGKDLLEILVKLLEEQEGVKIKYEIKEKENGR